MGILDRLLGRTRPQHSRASYGPGYRDQQYQDPGYRGRGYPSRGPGSAGRSGGRSEDEIAVERYRCMLRTAPPEQIEQAHAEAFARLTPEQRQMVLAEVGAAVPPGERASSDDPRAMARMATRAELRQPGTLERVLGRGGYGGGRGGFGGGGFGGGGMGMGGMIAGSLLASVAGAFVGTAIADAMFDMSDSQDGFSEDQAFADDGSGADQQAVADDQGLDSGDAGGDWGGGDWVDTGGDFGGDMGF